MAKNRSKLSTTAHPVQAQAAAMPTATLEIKDILGEKGQPMDINKALVGTNPNYDEGVEYQINCQRCVFAYEMRRRGYDVEAKPCLSHDDSLATGGFLNVMEDTKLYQINAGNTIWDSIDSLQEAMASAGDGTRAAIIVGWKNRAGGHVFVAEQVGGKTRYVDPQDGAWKNIVGILQEASLDHVYAIPMNDLKPGPLIAECVKKRG